MSQPSRFEFHMDCLIDDELLWSHNWHRVSGGGLPFPLLIRVGRAGDGRPIVAGLIIGDGDPVEVAPDDLRKIRIGAILTQLFEGFEPDSPPGFSWEDVQGSLDAQTEWGLMHEAVWQSAPAVDESTGRGPGADELQQFAKTYQRECVRNPRKAMAATAEALNISVATAHRRAALCRERGHLPRK